MSRQSGQIVVLIFLLGLRRDRLYFLCPNNLQILLIYTSRYLHHVFRRRAGTTIFALYFNDNSRCVCFSFCHRKACKCLISFHLNVFASR